MSTTAGEEKKAPTMYELLEIIESRKSDLDEVTEKIIPEVMRLVKESKPGEAKNELFMETTLMLIQSITRELSSLNSVMVVAYAGILRLGDPDKEVDAPSLMDSQDQKIGEILQRQEEHELDMAQFAKSRHILYVLREYLRKKGVELD